MNVVSRGIRNAFRNSIRTFSIVIILGLSIGLSLAMLVARASVQDKIASVKSSIGNTITISPAGSRGFEGGGEPLTTDQMSKVSQTANVTSVLELLSDRLTTENTTLQSSIEPGSLGNRSAGNNGVGFQAPPAGAQGTERSQSGQSGTGTTTRTFTPPVTITGTNNVSTASVFGGDTINFTSGQALNPTEDKNVAVVGKAIAEKNSLSVGSTFTAYGSTITVVGIYDTGNAFSNNGVIISLPTLQRLSGQPNEITSAVVTVNSIDNVDGAVTAIKAELGTSADVVSNQATAEAAVEPLKSVEKISTFSLIGAVSAGAIIILLTMVMVVRERRREIGTYKAIGASNLTIMFQFVCEALTLTTLGLVAGLIIGAAAASPLTNVLVSNSNSSSTSQSQQAGPGAGGPRAFRNVGNNALANARSVKASVGWDILGYGVITAMTIAVIGSAIPAFFISKVRPAEVMRTE